MCGAPPVEVPRRLDDDELDRHLERVRNVYSDGLIEVTRWCMALEARDRPQSVFALQRELAREPGRASYGRSATSRTRNPRSAVTGSARS
jgi:hypothetical protein